MDDRRSLWHIVAVIATLALAVVVAVVAVTRDEGGERPLARSPSPSPSPTAPESPGGLAGEGPYVIYAGGDSVFAFDVSTKESEFLGQLDGDPVGERSRQPGTGRVVAFPTQEGGVWSVTRQGLDRIGVIPPDVGRALEGAAVSADDGKIAIAFRSPEPGIVLVDLQSGRPTVIERNRRGEYPPEPLLPIAWSLGGGLVYEIPYCECDDGSSGLYALDLGTGSSTRLPGTESNDFFRLAVSPSGQALYYGTATNRRCPGGGAEACDGPPYFMRRLAAGQRGSSVLDRATDERFVLDAISPDGMRLLVRRQDQEFRTSRLELYSAEGERRASPRGVPAGAQGVALLPGDVIIAGTLGSLYMVEAGRADVILESGTSAPAVYLGWLR